MSRRPEVCRDFARGSCRFGSRCKFLHHVSQQPQSNSPFGFGTKNQTQQQPSFNKSGNYYASLSDLTSVQKQLKNQAQSQAKDHRCSNPRDCKLQIQEDLQNEQPSYWRLTCYAHWKFLPNDVVGDVSFEELRAHSYAASKQGVPFGNLMQNERSMQDAKNSEFQNLLRNPYAGPSSATTSFQSSGISSLSASPAIISPAFGVSSHPASPPQTNPFQSGGGVGNTGGFSFGLGASSTPAIVSSRSSQSPQPPGIPGYSFGIQSFGSSVPSSSMQGPFGVLGGTSQEFGKGGVGFVASNTGTNFLGNAKEDLSMRNSFAFQNVPLTLETMSIELPANVTPSKEPVSQFPLNQNSCPIPGSKDIWFNESWTLGEIPEDEPPFNAR